MTDTVIMRATQTQWNSEAHKFVFTGSLNLVLVYFHFLSGIGLSYPCSTEAKIYSETLKTPIRKFSTFTIYETFSKKLSFFHFIS